MISVPRYSTTNVDEELKLVSRRIQEPAEYDYGDFDSAAAWVVDALDRIKSQLFHEEKLSRQALSIIETLHTKIKSLLAICNASQQRTVNKAVEEFRDAVNEMLRVAHVSIAHDSFNRPQEPPDIALGSAA